MRHVYDIGRVIYYTFVNCSGDAWLGVEILGLSAVSSALQLWLKSDSLGVKSVCLLLPLLSSAREMLHATK